MYPRLVRWNERYANRGLKMVTIYGTENTKPEAMPALLGSRKMVHPVLLDPTSAYRKALGLAVYPVATLLDRTGRVVWQGNTQRRIADACEKQIEMLLAQNPEKEAGPGSKGR